MELCQLRTFITVAEEGNLTRSAELLNTNLPTINSDIETLEDELGVELFLQTPNGMKLTPDGAVIVGCASKVLQEVDNLLFKAKSLQEEVVGDVRLGVDSDPKVFRNKQFSEFMMVEHPKLTFHYLQGVSDENKS